MRIMASLLSVLLLAVVVTLTGCKTSEVGVKNTMGKVSGYMDALPTQVVEAAEQAAKDLGLTVDRSVASQLDGELVAKTAKGKKIKLDVNRYGDNISAVEIRVGTFGDERVSLQFYNAIKAKLANRARSASPPPVSDLNLLQ